MAVLNDYQCKKCGLISVDLYEPVKCCGKKMLVALSAVFSPEWSTPRQLIHLRDEPFGSRSELNAYTKANGLVQAASADKHGGARNEEHLNLGKTYSYKGAPSG